MDALQKRVLPGPGHLRRLGGAVGPEIGLVSVVAQDLAKGRAPAAGANTTVFICIPPPQIRNPELEIELFRLWRNNSILSGSAGPHHAAFLIFCGVR